MRRWGPPWQEGRRSGRFADPDSFRRGSAHPRRSWPAPVVATSLIQVISAHSVAGEGGLFHELTAPLVALLLAGPIVLLWRQRFPLAVFALTVAAALGFAPFAQPRWMFAAAPAVALFSLARTGRARAAAIGAGTAYVTYLLIFWVFAEPLGVTPGARADLRVALLLACGLAGAVFLGGAAKVRGEHLAEMVKVRAERARAREEQERRQASEERLRIAQELHDVLGHHLSLINVQAGVGLHLMDNRPEQAREALSAIKTASSEALREVRAVLSVLRTEDEAAPRQPVLGLSRLDELTADAGLPITTKVTGDPRELPAEVDRAAYRIVQEALTNVRRHAGPEATASIGVDYLPTVLHLAIRNVGPAPAAGDGGSGEGTGIGGMRARAQSLGGTLEAGPVDGGFLVSVLLPAADPRDPGENT
jgi:signal transduction histidine kinase